MVVIYCESCKWLASNSVGSYTCLHPNAVNNSRSWLTPYGEYQISPQFRNSGNNCEDYSKKE